VAHLPAAGEMVLFDRSWYNRAGVERVMGLLRRRPVSRVLSHRARVREDAGALGHPAHQYWFSISDEEQHLRFLGRIHDPLKQWKLSPMEPRVAPALGGEHQGQGNHAGAQPNSGGALVGGPGRRQEEGAAQLHPPSAQPDAVRGSPAPAHRPGPERMHHEDYVRHPVRQDIVVPEVY
jgi:polyphosphate kinase